MVSPQSQNEEWTQPTKSHGPRWSGFLMSALRNNCSGRRQAKCSFCSQVFLHGKPERLFRHIRNSCPEVPPAARASYLQLQAQEEAEAPLPIPDIPTASPADQPPLPSSDGPQKPHGPLKPPSDAPQKPTVPLTNPRKRPAPSTDADRDSKPPNSTRIKPNDTNELHLLLLKALVTSDVPFRLLENHYFQEYQRKLVRSAYVVPRQAPMADRLLESLHTQTQADARNRLWEAKNITLSLDGRIDPWGNAVYGLLALKGPKIKYMLDILEIPQQEHSAGNILSAVKSSLQKNNIDESNISAFVTDSRPVMVQLQETLTVEHPQIVIIKCVLHVFNSIVKDFLSHAVMDKIVTDNKILVDYFTTSDFWSQHLETWRKNNSVSTGLQSSCTSRRFSLPKICFDVCLNQGGFEHCQQILNDPSIECPSIPESVLSVLANQTHFENNHTLAILLKPAIDAFGRLELPSTNLADVWKELITAYNALRTASIPAELEEFRKYCLERLRVRSAAFDSDLYIMAFFLHPLYRRVVKRSLEEMTRMILQYAKIWKFTRGEAISLREQLGRYYGNLHPFTYNPGESESQADALSYWNSVPDSLQTTDLKRLAVTALEIVPHAATVEGLLPIVSATKTPAQNQMSSTALRQYSQVRYNLLQEMRNSRQSGSSAADPGHGDHADEVYNSVAASSMGTDEPDPALPVLVKSEKDSCVFNSFDLDVWEEVNTTSGNQQVIEFDENWELDEIFASFC